MIRCEFVRRAVAWSLAVALVTASQTASAVGVSADPRVPTSDVEHVIVLSRFPHAVVTVWPKSAAKVYVVPRPSHVVPGSVRFVKPRALRKLDRATAPTKIVVQERAPSLADSECLDTGSVLRARLGAPEAHDPSRTPPKSAAERMQDGVFGPIRGAEAAEAPEAVIASACTDDFADALVYRESSGPGLARIVRSFGGALPPSFVPMEAESFWVIKNPEGVPLAGFQFAVDGPFTMPIVAPARGGSPNTILVAFSDNQLSGATGPLTQRGIVSGFLPKEIDGLDYGGTYVFPETVLGRGYPTVGQVAALVAEPSFRGGASIVVESAAPVLSENIAKEVCGTLGLKALDKVAPGFTYDPFVVRARLRNVDRLTFENRALPRANATVFLAFENRPASVDEKSCLYATAAESSEGTVALGRTDPLVPIPKVSLRAPALAALAPSASIPCAVGSSAPPVSDSRPPPRDTSHTARIPPSQTRGCSASPEAGHSVWPMVVFLAVVGTRRRARVKGFVALRDS